MVKKITLVDILIEKREKEKKYFRNYLSFAKTIKKEAEKKLEKPKVFIFGSVVKGKAKIGSDIDILIVSKTFKDPLKRGEFLAKIEEKLGEFHPFEFHLVTPEDYKNWYSRFIKKEKILVE